MSSRRSASFILVASALSVGCGARSGLDCFGESCVRADGDEGGQQGFDPDEDDGIDDGDAPGGRPPFGAGGTGGSGGRPTRPSSPDADPFPGEVPSSQPIDMPTASFCSQNANTFDGSIDVGDETTLEALRGCTVIDGDLTIFGTNVSNLEPLSRLRVVTGVLEISSFAGTLDGLRTLESVNSFGLQNTSVATLSPLQNLFQIGSGRPQGGTLTLSQNRNLTDLAGLGNLQVVTSISISENSSLLTLAGLNVPGELETISIRDNPLLSDLSGLENLQLAQAVEIENSPALSNLTSLSNLQAATSLALVNVPSLTTLDLPIGSVQVFYLENVGLTNLNGLSGLRGMESAIIQNNPNLVDVDRLGSLESLAELSVINNSSLLRLPDFAGVISVEQVYVRNNPLLAAGPGYPLVADAGTILVSDNPSLTNLTGFRILQRAREIDISRNLSLVEVDLGTLGSVRSVRITCNAALPESSLEAVMLNVAGTVDVWGNQGSLRTCP